VNLSVRDHPAQRSEAVITLQDGGDPSAIAALKRKIDGALFAGRSVIVIDLLAVSDLDTESLGGLCQALRHANGGATSLAIVGADSRVRWVLELCEISRLEFHPSVKTALAHRRAGRIQRVRWRCREALAPARALNRPPSGVSG
jgi:anti-anti-sigma regulatory factor